MDSRIKAWKCSVCGYIHRGEQPPDWCPVCGSPREDFEPYEAATPAVVKYAATVFRCLVCNYVHSADSPPTTCPVCGTPADRFESVEAVSTTAAELVGGGRVVVVGAGIAGLSAVEALRSASPEVEITLVSKEKELPYYRLNLTRYLAGEIDESALPIHPLDWYEQQHIDLLRGAEAATIDLEASQLTLRNGERLPFDKLIVTIGAHPFVPPVAGAYREAVSSLRTLEDARRILEIVGPGANCVIIGGGVLGLETAGGLSRRGAKVSVLENYAWVLPRQLNARAGALLAVYLDGLGINLVKQAKTREIVGDERARGVRLEDDTLLAADLVVFATGVRPNSYLARLAGLEVNQGIIVDDHLASSHPNVLAAGDVAEHRGISYGIWLPAKSQGSIAGLNALGHRVEFGGIPRSNTLKVLGLDLFSIGKVEPEDGSYIAIDGEEDGHYARFLFRDTHMVGAILVGNTKQAAECKKAVETKADFSHLLAARPAAREVAAALAELA